MSLTTAVAIAGMVMGLVLMILGRTADAPRELRIVGGFLLVAGFCFLLGIQMPKLF